MLHEDLKLNYKENLVSEQQGNILENFKLKITSYRNRKKAKFFHLFYRNIVGKQIKELQIFNMLWSYLCFSKNKKVHSKLLQDRAYNIQWNAKMVRSVLTIQ